MAKAMHVFRKRQKEILVVVGLICIFTFTVGPIILDFFQPDVGAAKADVVVTWKGGSLDESDLGMLGRLHRLTIAYLERIVKETVKRGGSPKAAGVTQNRQGQVIDPGISRDDSEIRMVRMMLLAEEAEKLGMTVPDDAIVAFLAPMSDRTMSSDELRNLLQGATQGRLTRDQLFSTLRRRITRAEYLRLIASGDVMTPDDAWNYYNRLTRRINATVVEFKAEDYLATPTPSDRQIEEFYDKYKDQFPLPSSPDPGFKQHHQFAFGYLKAGFDKFMEEEKAKISAEDVQKHYDENPRITRFPNCRTAA